MNDVNEVLTTGSLEELSVFSQSEVNRISAFAAALVKIFSIAAQSLNRSQTRSSKRKV